MTRYNGKHNLDRIMEEEPDLTYKELAWKAGCTNKQAAAYLKKYHGRRNQHDYKKSLSYQINIEAKREG